MRLINYILVNLFIYVASFVMFSCQSDQFDSPRVRTKLTKDWKFVNLDVPKAQEFAFDDSEWRILDLPHDWAIEGPFSNEIYFQGGFLPYPGVGWYRKTVDISAKDKSVLLEFDGVMMNAQVWVNGEYVGEWAFGYSSFAFDISNFIKHDQKNIIAVRVENIDYSSRWYPGSGIYRNVWLNVMDPVHVAHWGTYVTTPEVTAEQAKISVKTLVENEGQETSEIVLESSVYDENNNRLTTIKHTGKIVAGNQFEFAQELKVENPRLWDIDHPYMYMVRSKIIKNGKIVDEYDTPFGIRTVRFDANKGFFLNGRSLKLKGVNMHHDLGPLGSAVSYRATERQLEILQEMGVNAIRTAHNPPSPEQLELCDRMGILVMDESFDEWRKPKHNVKNSYSRLFDKWAEKDMRALVMRDRNHPSVILWSTGNEVPELGTPDGKNSARMLANICRELDPTRPVSSGIHLSVKIDQELMDIFDVAGFNYWHEQMPDLHKTYPNKPLLVTEASATLSTRGEYHFPVERIYKKYNHESYQISSYDMINTGFGALPDVEFKLQDDSEWLAGQFVWSGFDYHGEPDPYEDMWPAHSSYFGIIDMCGFPKDRFYLYQSVWTDEPMIHVLPHWNWAGREGEVTPVYCYTNCETAELFVNGESMGKKEKNPGEYRIKWNDVVYQPGGIKVVGYDSQGNMQCEKEILTAAKPHHIDLEMDRHQIKADGEDLAFITVRIKDEDGNLCPESDNLVQFKVQGKGTIAAVGNGNPASLESYQADKRKAFKGMCLLIIRSTQKSGQIHVTASSPGLQISDIFIESNN